MTFDLDQTVADLRDLFQLDEFPADRDVAIARFTAERALRAYGCPADEADVIAKMIYYAACNVAKAAMNRAYGRELFSQYDLMEKARPTSTEVAA